MIGIGGIESDRNSFDTATGATVVGATDVGATVGSGVATAAETQFETSDGKLALQHDSASQKTVNTPGYMSGELSHSPAGL